VICHLDSNIVMYLIENRPLWGPKTAVAINRLRSSGDILAVSDLTRMECRVGPLRTDDGFLLQAFDAFFSATGVRMLPISSSVWDRAAWIRAKHRFRALDAIHLATAAEARCDVFLTNDNRLSSFPDIKVSDLP
jgi:predicted nucleic acid-binding protein